MQMFVQFCNLSKLRVEKQIVRGSEVRFSVYFRISYILVRIVYCTLRNACVRNK